MIDILFNNINKTFLQVDAINKKNFNSLNILKNFNLEIKNNEVLAIVGPSGIGKSTLLNILSGNDTDFEGQIKINRNISDKKMSFIFQAHNLLPWLTALENVLLICNKQSLENNSAYEILNEVGLKDFINVYPNNLSGGMKRRVSIARAFVNKPNILLMDEPFVSLEKPLANQLRNQTIKLINKNKVTAVLVTHDLKEAIMFANRIIFCNNSPMEIVLEKNISINDMSDYDSDEIDLIYKKIIIDHPLILEANHL